MTIKVVGLLTDGLKLYILKKLNTLMECPNYKTRIQKVCNMLYRYIFITKVIYYKINFKIYNLAAESSLLSIDGKNFILLKKKFLFFCLSGSVFNTACVGVIANPSTSYFINRTSGLELVGCMWYNNKLSSSNKPFYTKGRNMKILSSRNCIFSSGSKISFHTRCRAINRVGPHNIDIISVIVGLLLGDSYANNRTGEGVRLAIKQSIVHKEYLFFLYEFFVSRGYCTTNPPRKYARQINGIEKIYYGYEFNTFTFRSLLWIYKIFYRKGKKIIPLNIQELITPLTLSIWISDDGGKAGDGLRISCNNYTLKEVELLAEALKNKFHLDCTIQKIYIKNKYSIYIKKNSIPELRNLILPFLHTSIRYKLGIN